MREPGRLLWTVHGFEHVPTCQAGHFAPKRCLFGTKAATLRRYLASAPVLHHARLFRHVRLLGHARTLHDLRFAATQCRCDDRAIAATVLGLVQQIISGVDQLVEV